MEDRLTPESIALKIFYRMEKILGPPTTNQIAGHRKRICEIAAAVARDLGKMKEEDCKRTSEIAGKLFDAWVKILKDLGVTR